MRLRECWRGGLGGQLREGKFDDRVGLGDGGD